MRRETRGINWRTEQLTNNTKSDKILEQIRGLTIGEINKLDVDFGDSYPVMRDGHAIDVVCVDDLEDYEIIDDEYAIKKN